MKKLLLSIGALFICAAVVGQTSGGPDAYGYIWRDSNDPSGPAATWIDITTMPGATQVTGLGDDNTVGYFPIGFNMPYYWYTVNQFKIGSNGYIIFNNGAISHPFPLLPLTAAPNDFIGPFMSDLSFADPGNPGTCWIWNNLTDSCIVSFINAPFWVNAVPAYTGANTFQIVMTKVDSSVTFNYLTQQGASANGGSFVSVGMENNSGAVGLMWKNNVYPTANTSIKWYYPQSTNFQVFDASASYVDNAESGGRFISRNGAPFTMTAQVKNTGNQALNPFNTDLRVVNAVNVTQASQTMQVPALTPGQTHDLMATTTYNPTVAATYSFRTTTQLTGDATPSNNTRTMELVVVDTTLSEMVLSFTGATSSPANAGISWSGGNAGLGVEIVAPFAPFILKRVEYFIVSNAQNSSFYSLVYDNTGVANGPGALLDSSYVASPFVLAPNIWNPVVMPSPITVNTNSIFVGWMMDGEGITLGTDDVLPISNRSYELLGSWSIYRSREVQDVMIRAVIARPSGVGINEAENVSKISNFFPMPAVNSVSFTLNIVKGDGKVGMKIFNTSGQLVHTENISLPGIGEQRATLDISSFAGGMYAVEFTANGETHNRKLIVAGK